MGKVASHCIKSCEGGKKEMGEEDLESISKQQNQNYSLKENTQVNQFEKARGVNIIKDNQVTTTNRLVDCKIKKFLFI